MHETSDLYKQILSGDYWTNTRVTIGGIEYGASSLRSVKTKAYVFSGSEPSVGGCVSREIDIELLKPADKITGLAEIKLAKSITDGVNTSEWIPKGTYYIDTMEEDADENSVVWVRVHGYDAMLFAEQGFPENTTISFPATDIDVVHEIAEFLGIDIDPDTEQLLTAGYKIQKPEYYSCREVLGYIAAMYAGNFVMSDVGTLKLLRLWESQKETGYLVNEDGYAITFGGVRIIV